jgi:hypothetical protein
MVKLPCPYIRTMKKKFRSFATSALCGMSASRYDQFAPLLKTPIPVTVTAEWASVAIRALWRRDTSLVTPNNRNMISVTSSPGHDDYTEYAKTE